MTAVYASLRKCPVCQEIRRFIGTKCRYCGNRIPTLDLELYPPVESGRCRTCHTLVAAASDGQCGLCSAKSEHLRRRKSGTLTREDKSEFAYNQRRAVAKQINQQGAPTATCNAPDPEAPGLSGDLEREDKTVPLSD